MKELLSLSAAFEVMGTLAAESDAAVARGAFQLFVNGVGGPSGARLLGRFCHADGELHRALAEHLRAEEAAQPDAVFVELAHLPEGRIGNILARPVLRAYEIPYLGHSGAARARQLPVTDLLLSLRAGRLVLRSATLGCEVIPRLTSAHNWARASLGVYKFLCALQSQGVAAGLGWGRGALERAPFLPRVTAGRLVLAKAVRGGRALPGDDCNGAARPAGAGPSHPVAPRSDADGGNRHRAQNDPRTELRAALTDGEIERYFAQHKLSFDAAAISQIIVREEHVARELRVQIVEESAYFHRLARQYSIDEATRPAGGYAGRVKRAELAAAIESAVFGARAGKVVGPFKTDQGWALFKVEALYPATLDATTRQAISALLFAEWLQAQRRRARIQQPLLETVGETEEETEK